MLGGYISDLEVGDELKEVHHVVTPYECAEYAHGVEEVFPGFYEPTPDGARQFRMPTMVHADRIRLLEANCLLEQRMEQGKDGPDARIHYEYAAIHHAPIFAGDEVVISGRVKERYWRRDREYIDYEVELRAPDGRLLTSYRDRSLLRFRQGA